MKRSKYFRQVNDQTTELYDKVTKIQTDILDRINLLKKQKQSQIFICQHLVFDPDCPEYDPKLDYYDLFWKTYLLNEIKKYKVQNFAESCQKLQSSISWIEKKFAKYERLVSYRNKMVPDFGKGRSTQKFECVVQGCGKVYESMGALELHHKIKHQKSDEDFSSNIEQEKNIVDKKSNRR